MIDHGHTDSTGRPVTLHEVDADNWRAVADSAPRDDQRDWVPALAARYLVLSSREDTWTSLAVCTGDEVAGHIMWGRDEDGSHWIGGMLIDAAHQGTGIGRAAVRTLASWLSTRENGTAVRLSYAPANEAAAHLYTSLGFRPTGVEEDGEVVAEWG
ncbi:GNAT family N-acetyltransferase [Streptomyces anulatus]|uniref:GNAT family N-acetyltransferase n=1 Tax=Streptomyces TaxID=1883 RepID=UPI00085184ED|nr:MULTISPECIES: GNAT family N-acetyltransferase [Streptomyces]MBQ1108702.1 GNAT family N-acetyltransferase [Streptomyces sp. 404i]MDQ0698070.1 diamine N-acetyltransferase [Streptomyces sp. W4I9-2]MDX3487560.1 GNAT family N-acetyltransferase [Streptomyces sp. ID05-18]WIY76722.1 GNAT family N-acetyltransferase [Streptomyces anulatus]